MGQACAWTRAAATAGPWAGSACGRPCRSSGSRRLRSVVPSRPTGWGAVHLFEGALNYERFALYGSPFLAPALRRGGVLVLDNLAVHKIGDLQEWLAERGVEVLFLPPYSPDFSPIEQAWSKLKTALCPARARSR